MCALSYSYLRLPIATSSKLIATGFAACYCCFFSFIHSFIRYHRFCDCSLLLLFLHDSDWLVGCFCCELKVCVCVCVIHCIFLICCKQTSKQASNTPLTQASNEEASASDKTKYQRKIFFFFFWLTFSCFVVVVVVVF